jgi:chemotaxis protein histidine kinase CheA
MAEPSNRDAAIFPVDTRFQQMARRPGGVPRERAIEAAQRHLDELKPDFNNWLVHELQELAASIQQVSDNPSDAEMLERAQQACGQLRDVGSTMGYELVTFIANNLCDILDAIKAGATYDQSMIDCHMDALTLGRTEAYRGLRPEQVPEMARGLRRLVELTIASSTREGT